VDLVTLADVQAAAKIIADVAVRTPLLRAPWAGRDGDLWLKPESLQPVGSFKVRGAYHAIARLAPERRPAGVVTHSSGNHAQAVAYAARALKMPCVVVMPDVAVPSKIAATKALGAEVVLVPPDERDQRALDLVAARDATLIPPFDHPDVIAGQGTIGLEVVADLPDVDCVLVPVGGGGLASGVATAVKALRPGAAVVGVEPALAAETAASLKTGVLTPWPTERTYRTVADGLRTSPSDLTFAHLQARLDGMITVAEDEILDAVRALATGARLVAEPSGAVATAAYLYHRAELPTGRTVAVISGGNAEPATLAGILTRQPGPAGPGPTPS
jgi:threonine dehydratase